MSKEMKKAVFFDRDGVLNRKPPEHDYVKSHAEFFWNENARELIKKIKDLGFLAIVVSNQRGVARGMMTRDFVNDLHDRMNKDLKEIGACIDAFYYCPHDYKDDCNCRKPKPEMYFKASREMGIELSGSFVVGDSGSDIESALRAGCKAVKIETDIIDLDNILSFINPSNPSVF